MSHGICRWLQEATIKTRCRTETCLPQGVPKVKIINSNRCFGWAQDYEESWTKLFHVVTSDGRCFHAGFCLNFLSNLGQAP